MSQSVVELFDAAKDLAEGDRAALAGLLLESLDQASEPTVEAAWATEIERRIADIDAGHAKSVPWHEVKARLLAKERAD